MKKISAVLLVLVLVGSVAFAGFTGSATTKFGYDLDSGAYGFMNKGTAVSVDLNFLSEIGEAVGEGDIYASIKATLDFTFNNADESGVSTGAAPTTTYSSDAGADTTTPMIVTLDFDHAKVFGKDWYVSILGTLDAPNYAPSVIDSTDVARDTNPLVFDADHVTQFAALCILWENVFCY